jgi:hypothetical protein
LISCSFYQSSPASERYDSARIHYSRAESVLQEMEASWADPDLHDLEANQARHYLAFQA